MLTPIIEVNFHECGCSRHDREREFRGADLPLALTAVIVTV